MSVAPAFAPVCLDVYRTNVGIFCKKFVEWLLQQ